MWSRVNKPNFELENDVCDDNEFLNVSREKCLESLMSDDPLGLPCKHTKTEDFIRSLNAL